MAVVILSAGLLIALGVKGAWRQQQRLSSYRPVPAVVNKNAVQSSKFGGVEPDVLFAYSVGGKPYESSQVAPLRIHGSRDWAEKLTRRVQAEGGTAYYNPSDPSEAYLLPIGRFRPYGLILLGLTVLGLGLLAIRTGGAFAHEPVSLTDGPYDWFDLTPGGSLADRALGWSATTLLWYLLGGLTLCHYYLTTPPAYELKSIVSAILFAAAGAWPACRALSAVPAASRLGAPKAQTTRKTAHLGEPIIIRVEQPFLRDTLVRELRVALTCTRRNGLGSVRYFTASQIISQDRVVHAGEMLHGEFAFDVPDKKRHPSTPFTRWDYPRTDWQIEVTTRIGRSSTTITFPIIAENTHKAAQAA